MASEKTTALVLRTIDFSESSYIVTLFTRDFGQVHALAKGGRRLKGPFESALDLLSLSRVVFLRKSAETLNLLTEAKLERRFRPPAGNLASLYAGFYLAELLQEMTTQDDPHPWLFDQAVLVLSRLAEGEEWSKVVTRFELAALRELGHLPSFDQCVECGAAVPRQRRVPFGLVAGGVLCPDCRQGQKQVVSLSEAALHTLQQGSEDENPLPLERAVAGEVRGVLQRYLMHLLGHPLKMHEYLGQPGLAPSSVP